MTNIDPNFSTLWLAFFALSGGLIGLIVGGECLIVGAIRIANRAGMPHLLVGLTVVAFGTSMPELFVSVKATLSDHPDIMFGNVVGSNIANIGLVLALCATLLPLDIDTSRLKVELVLVVIAELLLMAFVFCGGFSRVFGMIFMGSLILYTFMAYWQESKRKKRQPAPDPSHRPLTIHSPQGILALVLGGLILMWFGSDFFIDGAVDIARFFGLTELVIGLTVAAVGTSLPELASSIAAIRRRQGDILVGNIVGSNLFNLLLVMGATAVIKPFAIPAQALYRDLPVMLGFTLVLIPISLGKKKMTRWHGVFLLAAYGAYIYLLG